MILPQAVIAMHCVLLAYTFGACLYVLFFLTQRGWAGRAGLMCTCFGLIAYAYGFLLRYFDANVPALWGLPDSLAFFASVIVVLLLIIELRWRDHTYGALVMPLAAILALFSGKMQQAGRPLPPALQSPWLAVHVSLCFIGYAFFLLAFCFAIFYLWQESEVKSRKPGIFFFRLPSLGLLDKLGYMAVGSGFVFLTAGIFTGSVWAYQAWGSFWSWDPKETWALVMWLVYLFYLHGRLIAGWRGRKSAWLAIAGFAVMIFTYLGVSFLLPGLHSYL